MVLKELNKTNRDWNTFLFLENYDPKLMHTPSKRFSYIVKPQIAPAASRRKRKEQQSSKEEAKQIKYVLKEKKIVKGKGIMKEKDTHKTKEAKKGK